MQRHVYVLPYTRCVIHSYTQGVGDLETPLNWDGGPGLLGTIHGALGRLDLVPHTAVHALDAEGVGGGALLPDDDLVPRGHPVPLLHLHLVAVQPGSLLAAQILDPEIVVLLEQPGVPHRHLHLFSSSRHLVKDAAGHPDLER
jgi:hypothetical protein